MGTKFSRSYRKERNAVDHPAGVIRQPVDFQGNHPLPSPTPPGFAFYKLSQSDYWDVSNEINGTCLAIIDFASADQQPL
jgi:hypothetical protein